MEQEAHYYDMSVEWTELRKGTLSTGILNDKLDVATPPEFKNGIAGIWSPEHLFIAAVNSCLMTTFLAIADASRLEYNSFKSDSKGKLESVDGKFMISEIILKPTLSIKREEDREKAERILHKSEAACLISNSIKSTIIFEPTIIVEA